MAELNGQGVELERQLRELENMPDRTLATLEQTKRIFLGANKAQNQFINGGDDKKYKIVNSLLLNAWFKDKKNSGN